jgi:hypothetical protein
VIEKLIQELDKKALDKLNDYKNFNDFDSVVSNWTWFDYFMTGMELGGSGAAFSSFWLNSSVVLHAAQNDPVLIFVGLAGLSLMLTMGLSLSVYQRFDFKFKMRELEMSNNMLIQDQLLFIKKFREQNQLIKDLKSKATDLDPEVLERLEMFEEFVEFFEKFV